MPGHLVKAPDKSPQFLRCMLIYCVLLARNGKAAEGNTRPLLKERQLSCY